MMTRIERATVGRALSLPRRLTIRRWRSLRKAKHPRFHAHLITCDRCAFRRGVERSTRY